MRFVRSHASCTRSKHHEEERDNVLAVGQEHLQVLFHRRHGGCEHLLENGVVAGPEFVAEQVLRRGTVHQQLVGAAEEDLVLEALPGRLSLVCDEGRRVVQVAHDRGPGCRWAQDSVQTTCGARRQTQRTTQAEHRAAAA